MSIDIGQEWADIELAAIVVAGDMPDHQPFALEASLSGLDRGKTQAAAVGEDAIPWIDDPRLGRGVVRAWNAIDRLGQNLALCRGQSRYGARSSEDDDLGVMRTSEGLGRCLGLLETFKSPNEAKLPRALRRGAASYSNDRG